MPELTAVRRQAATWPANSPVSTALSASITRPPSEEATLSPVMAPIMAASRSRNSVTAASPRTAAPNSATFSGAMPPSQSSPSAVYGATPAMDPAARQRPGRVAAQASACGPPPDQPSVTKVPAPRSSRTAPVSSATSTTRRPGRGVEPS